MNPYLGIVVENSLKSPSHESDLKILSSKQVGSWVFLLVSAEDGQLDHQIEWLQANMDTDECWYAHYFRGDQMIVVFPDKVFHATRNPDTWANAVDYGLERGIPKDQLTFSPNSTDEATRFFARAMLVH